MGIDAIPAAGTLPEVTRFGFGLNWQNFLGALNGERVAEAERSFDTWLGADRLDGKSFLDIGSGSGLSSLVAMKLGAERVHSFDYDGASVASTQQVKQRFFPDSPHWTVQRGDVTDAEYMTSLGTFDIVYAWGVLHHTGALWKSLDIVCQVIAPEGRLWISVYNDQGQTSERWRRIKRGYNRVPRRLRVPYVLAAAAPWELRSLGGSLIRLNPKAYIDTWTGRRERGMSRWHDLVDWVGGYPFEVATPEQIFEFCSRRGLALLKLSTAGGGHGTNQFVFARR